MPASWISTGDASSCAVSASIAAAWARRRAIAGERRAQRELDARGQLERALPGAVRAVGQRGEPGHPLVDVAGKQREPGLLQPPEIE